jgi:hypothetical protein
VKYTVFDQINGPQHFENLTDAENLLQTARVAYLEREAVRFCMSVVFVEGTNTLWRDVKEDDSEEGSYRVFNHYQGIYEEFTSKSTAKLRMQELKDLLVKEAGLDKVHDYTPPATQIRVAVPGEIV